MQGEPREEGPGSGTREITVRYYAGLREETGTDQEAVRTSAETVGELYRELAQRHALPQSPDYLKAAVNHRFGDWDAPLSGGDVVAFLPPFAGG